MCPLDVFMWGAFCNRASGGFWQCGEVPFHELLAGCRGEPEREAVPTQPITPQERFWSRPPSPLLPPPQSVNRHFAASAPPTLISASPPGFSRDKVRGSVMTADVLSKVRRRHLLVNILRSPSPPPAPFFYFLFFYCHGLQSAGESTEVSVMRVPRCSCQSHRRRR